MSTVPEPTYSEQAESFDAILDGKLASISRAADASELTTLEAALLRVRAYQHHIEVHRALRREHFGGEE